MSDRSRTDTVLLAHGSGGRMSHRLVEEYFLPAFANPALNLLEDSSLVDAGGVRVAMTTDSYVVDPLFFPGGDIGRLAVCGTVNDLAVSGARPLALTAGFILEEGFPLADLRRILDSMRAAALEAGVAVVAGDTKVVPRGKGDKVFVNTAGVGLLPPGREVGARCVRPGDAVLINGPVGDHGIAVMLAREGFQVSEEIRSDCAPLFDLIDPLFQAGLPVHAMRDPTRGGLATTLNEIASAAKVRIEIDEDQLPVRPSVQGAAEIFGFDPLYLANEGKVVLCLPAEFAGPALGLFRKHPLGDGAAVIGRVLDGAGRPAVTLRTQIGGSRILDMLVGEQLPRIC